MLMQIIFLVIGLVICLSAFWPQIKGFVKDKVSKDDTTTITIEEKIIVPDTARDTFVIKQDFAAIVGDWERFVNVLIRNNMPECAEDMKSLLVKMAEEYRSELNDKDNTVQPVVRPEDREGSIDSILVVESKE